MTPPTSQEKREAWVKFASHALSGYLAMCSDKKHRKVVWQVSKNTGEKITTTFSDAAGEYADAMLLEWEKRFGKEE